MTKSYKAVMAMTVVLVLALLPALARADWPERPEDESAPPSGPGKVGAGIELWVSGAVGPVSAVVQWQDGLGTWHDIDGWRGEVEDDTVLWFVAEKDFSTGPYRWVVYDDTGTLGTGESFDMPTGVKQLVQVVVSID